ncbi:PadR family transcriptional regulator [Ornithinibacillus scapharcae]|uniref:PadR family transcriptional regulator n=1 Tax=Ornithinibacillus scapharcae TaxID=1147159 RepID=UPI000225B3BE|nr:PadR family transcriptional regulator [Ornithinibacillus scapharcae]
MNEPMKNLRSEMKKTVFKGVSFSDERKSAVLETIRKKQSHTTIWKEDTILAVLESIRYQSKHGYDISTDLYRKREISFHKREGELYTLLHTLEAQDLIRSNWIDEKKYYLIHKKGLKYLASCEQGEYRKSVELSHTVEEARW